MILQHKLIIVVIVWFSVCPVFLYGDIVVVAEVSGQEKDQAKQIFTSSAASGILTNDLVKILQDEKVHIVTVTLLLAEYVCVFILYYLFCMWCTFTIYMHFLDIWMASLPV